MKTIFLLTLVCVSSFGADNGMKVGEIVLDDIRVVTTAKTNVKTGSITMRDVITRDGKPI